MQPTDEFGVDSYRQLMAALRRNVLIVEPDRASRRLVAEELARNGIDVMVTGFGADALSLHSAHAFDAVLLNADLPDLESLDVLRSIVANESAQAPVLVLSVDATERSEQLALAAGATSFVGAPIHVRNLVAVIHRTVFA